MKTLTFGYEYECEFVSKLFEDSTADNDIVVIDNHFGPEVIDGEVLKKYDWVILCVETDVLRKNIYEMLSQAMGDDSRILDFYALYRFMVPQMNVDCVMKNPLVDEYQGMILGLSHSEVGILPRLLEGNWANLSVSSQDLFYSVKTLEHCLTNYFDKIKNLKYVVLDMYDYSYFNYDLSRGKNILSYVGWGGYYLDGHNFALNKNINCSFEDAVLKIMGQSRFVHVSEEKLRCFGLLFGNVHEKTSYRDWMTPWNVGSMLYRFKMLDANSVLNLSDASKNSIVSKKFEDTIEENIALFDILLDALYSINPEMKVFVTLIPRYIGSYRKNAEAYSTWKNMFYETIKSFNDKYSFEFLDFTEDEISHHKEYYQDESHFNYWGAVKFTEKLKTYM